ncbi:hypothetical protein D3C71_2075880 [compost metagenome]
MRQDKQIDTYILLSKITQRFYHVRLKHHPRIGKFLNHNPKAYIFGMLAVLFIMNKIVRIV